MNQPTAAVAMTFINLPVADLARTMTFYKALGFTFNPQFSDDTAAAMVINPTTFTMLLTHPKFDGFTTRPRPDAAATTGALFALSLPGKAAVDTMMAAAIAAGGTEYRPTTDLGFMYGRAFADPDGHVWEPFWMNASFAQS